MPWSGSSTSPAWRRRGRTATSSPAPRRCSSATTATTPRPSASASGSTTCLPTTATRSCWGFYAAAKGREAKGLARLALAQYLEEQGQVRRGRSEGRRAARRSRYPRRSSTTTARRLDKEVEQSDEEYAYQPPSSPVRPRLPCAPRPSGSMRRLSPSMATSRTSHRQASRAGGPAEGALADVERQAADATTSVASSRRSSPAS